MADARPITVAHRAGNHPETLPGVHASRIDYAEADIWLHDGRLEIRHLKTMGRLPLLWDRWRLAPGWSPRLELARLLDAWGDNAGEGAQLMLDLKGDDLALSNAIDREMRRAGIEHYHITGRAWHTVERFRDRPDTRLFPSAGYQEELDALLGMLGDRHYAVNVHETLVTPANVDAIHDRGARVLTWPINDRQSAARVLQTGVDGLISDNFSLLDEYARERHAAAT